MRIIKYFKDLEFKFSILTNYKKYYSDLLSVEGQLKKEIGEYKIKIELLKNIEKRLNNLKIKIIDMDSNVSKKAKRQIVTVIKIEYENIEEEYNKIKQTNEQLQKNKLKLYSLIETRRKKYNIFKSELKGQFIEQRNIDVQKQYNQYRVDSKRKPIITNKINNTTCVELEQNLTLD